MGAQIRATIRASLISQMLQALAAGMVCTLGTLPSQMGARSTSRICTAADLFCRA